MFCLLCSLATAILDYHIFLSLSTTFFHLFWNLFFYSHSFFRFHIYDVFCCFPVTLLSASYINISNGTCQLFLFPTFQLHTVFTCQSFTMSSICLILHGKRRKRDLNPRTAINDLLPFQGSPFSHLGISPKRLPFFRHKKTTDDWLVVFLTQRVGFEPTRPFGQTVFKTASLWPLRYLCIY